MEHTCNNKPKPIREVRKDDRRWRAQYPGYVDWFDTREDAENQRQKWVEEFGKPIWGTPPEELRGQVFGNLIVIEYAGTRLSEDKHAGAMWLCKNQLTDLPI